MAIARDNSTSVNAPTAGGNYTLPFTCTGSNRILFVLGDGNASAGAFTGFTYNGVALTKIGSDQGYANLWYLINPASGTNNLVFANSASASRNVVVVSYNGVDQTNPINTNAQGASTTPRTESVTTTRNNCWAVLAAISNSPSASTHSTLFQNGPFGGEAIFDNQAFGVIPKGSFGMTTTASSGVINDIMAAFAPSVTTFYWIGGTGNWNDSAHWSDTSGGTSVGAIPVSSSTVIFDANSGGGTVTVNTSSSCTSLTTTDYTGTITQSSNLTVSTDVILGNHTFTNSAILAITGNLTLGASTALALSSTLNVTGNTTFGATSTVSGSGAWNQTGNLTLTLGSTITYSGTFTLNSTTTQTITTGGKTIPFNIIQNGVAGTYTLQDAFTTTGSITVTNGTLAFNAQNVTGTSISNAGTVTIGNGTIAFSSTGTNTGTITFGSGASSFTTFTNSATATLGSGTISLTGTGTVWNNTGTITANTSTIKLTDASSSGKTFIGGNSNYLFGTTYNNLWITGSGTGAYTIIGSSTFNDFKVDTPPHTVNFTAGSRQTVSTFTVSGTAGNLNTLQSTVAGTQWGIASTGISIDYVSLQDSEAIKL